MLRKIKNFLSATALIGTLSVYAISFAETNIAIVDMSKIMEASSAYKNIISQIEGEHNKHREKIQKSEAQFKKKHQELQAQKNALSKEVLESKNEALSKEAADLQRLSYNERSILEKAHMESVQKLGDKILEIIKNKSQEKKYNVVIEKNSTAYVDDNLDITDVILESLNKSMPSIKVDFEGARKSNEKNSSDSVNKG